MARKIIDSELENEKLSDEFNNQIENFGENFVDDSDAIHGTVDNPPRETKFQDAPEKDELTLLLESVPPNTDVSIIVNRKADQNLKFRLPCKSYMRVAVLIWGVETLDSIYDEIQKTHGGGRYQFQLHYAGGFKKTWEQTLNDPPELSKAELTLQELERKAKADEQPRTFEPSPTFGNEAAPVVHKSAARELIGQFKELRELESLFAPKTEAAPPVVNPSMSFQEQLILNLMQKTPPENTAMTSKLTDYAFGVFESAKKEDAPSFAGLVKDAIKNPNEVKTILGIVGSTISSFWKPSPQATAVLPLPASTAPVNLEAFRQKVEPITEQPVETPPNAPEIVVTPIKKVEW